MSTNLKDLMAILETELVSNTTINTFCTTNFGKLPKIFIGIDPRNPPELQDNCPMIIIAAGSRAREEKQMLRFHTLHVGCAIEKNIQTRTGRVVKFPGSDLVDDFMNVVEAAVTKKMNTSGYSSSQDPSFEDENTFPYFKAIVTYVVRCPSILPR